ncbi:hypothetical protein A5819_003752 [Enterococcus sp. 7E2_DIV0204]|uniref:hypothetical protein n=1 Tax=unclassified Enterococcus TaxID=2608891 RepID=UPI000A34C7FE|nr:MULTISPECIES: hypothetical protein [unclassified Enterococcus]OTN83772.1 hypothetical protein A5819_003752 [Enterococcus sp. 7E2_DIV0204]OTP47143.1 hypothetical protein A5884_003680 [Enterococcus sp. 7D2_DIV0200]
MGVLKLRTTKEDTNKQFILATQPQGGMAFNGEHYAQFGNGYRATIHVVDMPSELADFWLYPLVSKEGVIATVDYRQDETIDYDAEVTETVNLVDSQIQKATGTELTELEKEYSILIDLSQKMSNQGETIKFADIKLYIHKPTLNELEEKTNDIITKLKTSGFTATPFLDQQKQDWQGLFVSYKKQRNRELIKRFGLELPSEAIAEGFAHNQTYLHDPTGFPVGHTQTGGMVYFDQFHKDADRLSYNMFLSGMMGSSKSTTLKKLAKDQLARGNYVFGYDKTGEFKDFTKKHNGLYLLVGDENERINMMQIFPTVTDDYGVVNEDACFTKHLELTLDRFDILSRFLNETIRDEVNNILLDFYKKFGFYNGSPLHMSQLENWEYPTLETFDTWFSENREQYFEESFDGAKYLRTLLKKIMNNYRKLLVGHTTFRNLTETKCNFFDISMINDTMTTVYDCLFHLVNTYVTDTCLGIGRQEKRAYENKEKTWWEITRCLIINDECQNTLNLNKPYATSSFAIGMSEGRKFFIGYTIATQLIERMFPKVDNIADPVMARAAQSLSELIGLCQYKFFMKQSDTSIPVIKKYFGHHFRDEDYLDMTDFQVTPESGAKMMLVGATNKPLAMYFEVSQDELDMFKGGA